MNTCVSDDKHIVNIQGIRYVHWGEANTPWASQNTKPFYVTVNYKGNHTSFGYETEIDARTFYNLIREAMDKTARERK